MEKNNPYNNNKIMTEMNTTMNSITEKFFTGCKKMENKKNLEDYKEKAIEYSNSKCLLRDTEHISGTKFKADWVSKNSDDVFVNHFDEHGNQQEFVKDYIIQRNGRVYTCKDGSRDYMSLDDIGRFKLTLKEPDENGKKRIQPKQTFLQCTSYFRDYDGWKVIMQNRGTNGRVQVDHVLQENEPDVDIQCLDLVTCAENNNRKCLDPKNKKTIKKVAES